MYTELSNQQKQKNQQLKETLLTVIPKPLNKQEFHDRDQFNALISMSEQLTRKRVKSTSIKRSEANNLSRILNMQGSSGGSICFPQNKDEGIKIKEVLTIISQRRDKMNRMLQHLYKKNKNIKQKKVSFQPNNQNLDKQLQLLKNSGRKSSMSPRKYCPQIVKCSGFESSPFKTVYHIKYQSKKQNQSDLGFGLESCTTKKCHLLPRNKKRSKYTLS